MSRDRAMAVLFECAGTQFDPQLVRDFCSMLGQYDVSFHAKVARRWLTELHSNASKRCLEFGGELVWAGKETPVDSLFRQSLVAGMLDGVIFVGQLRTSFALEPCCGAADWDFFKQAST